jgi:hypothetical protein
MVTGLHRSLEAAATALPRLGPAGRQNGTSSSVKIQVK